MRIFAFGDIHGEIHKLKALIRRVFPEENDKLVFLGDYIDRGKYSFEVIDYLIELGTKYDCVFLMGNHEQMFMDYLSGINEKLFTGNGGNKTLKSYYKHGYSIQHNKNYTDRKMPLEHIKFFQTLKLYYETDDFIFVHAGIVPDFPLDVLPDNILLWNRTFQHDDYKGKVVVFGHTPNDEILNEKYKICIDTGACFDFMGDLTCVQLPERIFTRQGAIL